MQIRLSNVVGHRKVVNIKFKERVLKITITEYATDIKNNGLN